MGFFRKCVYKKDKNNKWFCVNCSIEKAPHDVGRWEQSNRLEKKSKLGERSFYTKEPTKSGVNQKVTQIRTYFGKDEKVVRTLITTSNKLPQRFYKR